MGSVAELWIEGPVSAHNPPPGWSGPPGCQLVSNRSSPCPQCQAAGPSRVKNRLKGLLNGHVARLAQVQDLRDPLCTLVRKGVTTSRASTMCQALRFTPHGFLLGRCGAPLTGEEMKPRGEEGLTPHQTTGHAKWR